LGNDRIGSGCDLTRARRELALSLDKDK